MEGAASSPLDAWADGDARGVVPAIDMFTMIVLRRQMEAVISDMVNALFRTGRSGVLNTAMDFSCSITDSRLRSVSTALGLPVHVGAIHLIPKAVLEKFGDDIHPGDCFVNNSAYHGNTHCGDFTLCAPVFFDGEIVFYSVARAHLGDMGFPTPTTYGPLSRDLYEEGLLLPCVRIQRAGQDVQEVIDICRANIRVPDQFYGDYLATLAAVRTGERRIQEICKQYGLPLVRQFLEQFQDYASLMAIDAIRQLPKGKIEDEYYHDSEGGVYPDGIPIRATLEVDPDQALITIDLRNNVDNLPLGINLSEATTTAACFTAVLSVLGPDVPRCTGAFDHIRLLMRDGAAIGRPRHPAATSAATTNLAHLLCPLIQSMFAKLKKGLGSAFGGVGLPASCSVMSGADPRYGGRPFVNQVLMGFLGGPALSGHDGWVTYGSSSSLGVLWQSSVEITEQQHPIIVEKLEIGADSGGAGEWNGAPGAICVFRSRSDGIRYTTNSAARAFPPRGAAGGLPGGSNWSWREDLDGRRTELPNSFDVTLKAGERLISEACGGGGYGDPLDRDPERVVWDLREGWISPERCLEVFGVVIDTSTEEYRVDHPATAEMRSRKRRAQVSASGI